MKTLSSTGERLSFARFQALPDKDKPGFYAGVLIIEKGPAKGHYAVKEEGGKVVNYDGNNPEHLKLQKYPIQIGDVTLDDVLRCGNEADNVKCKLDHGATVRDIVGDYATFKRDGDQVRADLSLMESTPHRAYVEEIITKYSKKIGNSIDFDYVYDIKGNVAVARCVKLNSVDIVDAPAATNSLFQEQPNPNQYMPLTAEDLTAIRGCVKDEVTAQFSAVETKLNTRFDEIKAKMEDGEESDEDKKKKEAEEKEGDAKLSTLVKTAALAAVREVLPKTTLENLATLGQQVKSGTDQYQEKHDAAIAAGIKPAQAAFHIARTFPAIYNAKFGNGEAAKKTTL